MVTPINAPPGIVDGVTLDSIISGLPMKSMTLTTREVVTVSSMAGGSRREARGLWTHKLEGGDGMVPLKVTKHDLLIKYRHLDTTWQDRFSRAYAVSGIHLVAPWKPVYLAYIGNGTATEFWVPWLHAPHTISNPTTLTVTGANTPEVRIGRETDPIPLTEDDQAAYDTGPGPGEAIYLNEGEANMVKLGTALGVGVEMHLRIWPLFSMIFEGAQSREYRDVAGSMEPRDYLLMEV